MRRRVGVGHFYGNRAEQKTLADIGATLSAERVGAIADDLDNLTLHLKQLAEKHADRIRDDKHLRARFRELAHSLGVNLVTTNDVIGRDLGMPEHYGAIAAKVIQICDSEAKFCGSFVSLQLVLEALNNESNLSCQRTRITEREVATSISKLNLLGTYAMVKIGGKAYINTACPLNSQGSVQRDLVDIVTAVESYLKQQRSEAYQMLSKTEYSAGVSTQAGRLSTALPSAKIVATESEVNDMVATFQPKLSMNLLLSLLLPSLQASPHRILAALQELLKNGEIWIDVDPNKLAQDGTSAVDRLLGLMAGDHINSNREGVVWDYPLVSELFYNAAVELWFPSFL